ncbi:hypothetical protein ACFY2R_27255 [Micromonospora olivasterospora]|uniref:Uncharacterized protein n=1 Tax=Micromonospora olivasterospora TaxID=1880 RepID=A0A562IGF2_MICOL|nr:hypothetical protein [Micromonospora olivasterospora]TWH69972.1 hypothetical protein JD77_04990 [Micromonospora olivasterospora]
MTLNLDGLTGYVERDLDADPARWFTGRPTVTVPAETRPGAPFLDRLPPSGAAALAAFDRRAGALERAAVEADFLSLGQPGALEPELGLLRSMK